MSLKIKTLEQNERLYHLGVPIIGLTGGIASGKSTVAEILQENGCSILNADKLVKTVYRDQKTIDFIQGLAPQCVKENEIDFKALRKFFFKDSQNQAKIEEFIYKKLPGAFIKEFNSFQNPEFIIYDVPLLFEKGLDKGIDYKVCVYTTYDLQLERLVDRDDISKELAKTIISKQMPLKDKCEKSDYVIENLADYKSLESAVKDFLNIIID